MVATRQDVTALLRAWSHGDADAGERLLPIVYVELRRQAARLLRRERRDHTLQPTALVHETYLRLIEQRAADWKNRAQFFARPRRCADPRGPCPRHGRASGQELGPHRSTKRAAWPGRRMPTHPPSKRRWASWPCWTRQGRMVELRFFAGLSLEETAAVLGSRIRRSRAMAPRPRLALPAAGRAGPAMTDDRWTRVGMFHGGPRQTNRCAPPSWPAVRGRRWAAAGGWNRCWPRTQATVFSPARGPQIRRAHSRAPAGAVCDPRPAGRRRHGRVYRARDPAWIAMSRSKSSAGAGRRRRALAALRAVKRAPPASTIPRAGGARRGRSRTPAYIVSELLEERPCARGWTRARRPATTAAYGAQIARGPRRRPRPRHRPSRSQARQRFVRGTATSSLRLSGSRARPRRPDAASGTQPLLRAPRPASCSAPSATWPGAGPRRARGRRTDLSRWAMLFEMLTGQRAFRRHGAETLAAVLQHDPMPALEDAPTCPSRSCAWCGTAWKQPDERVQSARDLAFALEPFTRLLSPDARAWRVRACGALGAGRRRRGRRRRPAA